MTQQRGIDRESTSWHILIVNEGGPTTKLVQRKVWGMSMADLQATLHMCETIGQGGGRHFGPTTKGSTNVHTVVAINAKFIAWHGSKGSQEALDGE